MQGIAGRMVGKTHILCGNTCFTRSVSILLLPSYLYMCLYLTILSMHVYIHVKIQAGICTYIYMHICMHNTYVAEYSVTLTA